MASSPPAALLNGRLSLATKIGEGGMAVVHEAYDHDLAVWRAIKFLKPELAKRKGLRRRFMGEAHALARLEHRNVVRIYDVGEEEGWPFLVMSLTRGGSLESYLEKHGSMDPRLAVEAMLQVCAGVTAAHQSSIIHRDLKPDNVLITARGICKVTDFGIARIEENQLRATRTGSVMGTLGYMAPEQQRDAKHLDAQADVFSLGATLFALVTGDQPTDLFMATHHPEMVEAVHPLLRSIVVRACDFSPSDRYPSVSALAAALQATLTELPVNDAPPLAHSITQPGHIPTRTPPPSEPTPEPDPEETGPIALPYSMPTVERSSDAGPPAYIDHNADARQSRKLEALERLRALKKTTNPEDMTPVEEPTEDTAPRSDPEQEADPSSNVFGDELKATLDLALRLLLNPLSSLFMPFMGLGLLICFILLYGVYTVRSPALAAVAARTALYHQIRVEAELIDDLQAIGADSKGARVLYKEMEHSGDAKHYALAMTYVQMCEQQVSRQAPRAPPLQAHRAQLAIQRIERLTITASAARTAHAAWKDAAESGIGSMVCALRLTTCP